MQYLVINLILVSIFIIYFRRLQIRKILSINTEINILDASYNKLIRERKYIQYEISKLEKVLNETIALYDVTKEICKTLVEQEVLVTFKEKLSSLLEFEDCICLANKDKLPETKDYTLFPLVIENQTLEFLAIKGLNNEAKDILPIMINQFTMCLKRIKLYQKLQELAITDSLTGVFSRRYCLERLNEEINRSLEFKFKFSILMIDIDHFKRYNDHYGHLVGDAILREVSLIIKNNIRSIDLLSRFGGEEFVVILPQTSKELTKIAAERIREAINKTVIKVYDETLKINISIGASTFPDDTGNQTELIDKADFALYRAKKMGRNQVCLYGVYE